MSGSVNKVIIIGRLTRDPEMRSTNDGRSIANLNVATSETWRDRNSGERKEKSEFHRVVCFDEKICEVIQKYLTKGSTVYLEGTLQTRKWTDQQGVEKYTTEVVLQRFSGKLVMLGGVTGNKSENVTGNNAPNAAGGNTDPGGGGFSDLDDSDSIPF